MLVPLCSCMILIVCFGIFYFIIEVILSKGRPVHVQVVLGILIIGGGIINLVTAFAYICRVRRERLRLTKVTPEPEPNVEV